MTPVIPYSISNVSLIPGMVFSPRQNYCSTRFSLSGKTAVNPLCPQNLLLPLSTSFGVLSLHGRLRVQSISATGTDVAVEEPNTPVAGGEGSTEAGADPSKRLKPARKSDMPPVPEEELVIGATFTGKVKSIHPFGAFVDFGSFTDGLVHVSQLSDSFVKEVGKVVSVGQEVKVRLLEANKETGRISLSMRSGEASSSGKGQGRRESSGGRDREGGGPGKRNASKPGQRQGEPRKVSKFVKGQDLEGTVKNMNRAGAFISLPEGEEGFLPMEEELDDSGFGTMMGETTLELGQEVSVRVLRISRGQLTLTMKKEENAPKGSFQVVGQGVVHTATNPFLLAFRKNKEIAAFLDEREKVSEAKPVEPEKEVVSKTEEAPPVSPEAEASAVEEASSKEEPEEAPPVSPEAEASAVEEASSKDKTEEAPPVGPEAEASAVEEAPSKDKTEEAPPVGPEAEASAVEEAPSKDELEATIPSTDQTEATSEAVSVEESVSTEDTVVAEPADLTASSETSTVDEATQVQEEEKSDAPPEQIVNELTEQEVGKLESAAEPAEQIVDEITEQEEGKSESAAEPSEQTVGEVKEQVEGKSESAAEATELIVDEVKEQEEGKSESGAEPAEQVVSSESSTSDEVKEEEEQSESGAELVDQVVSLETSTTDDVTEQATKEELPVETPPPESVDSSSTTSESDVSPNPDENGSVTSSDVQSIDPPAQAAKATISPALVKQLREETGAGMMDCKNALSETGGDIVKAQEFLRKKGLASAEKKASRVTAEGRIGSYIHDGRIGVLVEVNCETDFVSRGDIFKDLVEDLAMQVAACPQVRYLSSEDVPEEIVAKERELELQKEDLASKPEQMRARIVEGRVKKRLDELALLEQPYIKNDKVLIKDWVKQTIATVGENMKVRRFARFNLGEGLEKKSLDFAAEVAAQTAAKPVTKPQPAAPAEEATTEVVEKAPTVAVSAALVKQLREESGAGMMDCKRALSETGGDLEKAQEYLRKKGLSSADKKSSRLAAEGRIGSYIHDSRIGVLIEVNCETDFVGRSEKFKELVDDLAMQVVACPQVRYVSVDDVAEEVVRKEKELEMQREDLQSKPENIREKIVEGRVNKRLGELALLEQAYIKDDGVLVKDLVKQTVAALGENIKVRRFVRFTLGEPEA